MVNININGVVLLIGKSGEIKNNGRYYKEKAHMEDW